MFLLLRVFCYCVVFVIVLMLAVMVVLFNCCVVVDAIVFGMCLMYITVLIKTFLLIL